MSGHPSEATSRANKGADDYEDDFESISTNSSSSDFTEISTTSLSTNTFQLRFNCRGFPLICVENALVCDKRNSTPSHRQISYNIEPRNPSQQHVCGRKKRVNMSFSNEETRKIVRENQILLRKIMAQSNSKKADGDQPARAKSSAHVNRMRQQQKINRENHILLQKIQNGIVASNSSLEYVNVNYNRVWMPFGKVQSVLKTFDGKEEWTDCSRSLQGLLKNIKEWDIDSLRLIDSWGKPNSGILDGNLNQYGNFDECLRSKIKLDGFSDGSKYCLISLEVEVPNKLVGLRHRMYSHYAMRKGTKEFNHRLPHFSEFKWGSCIPSSCPSEVVEMLLNDTTIHLMGEEFVVNAKAREEQCYTNEESQSYKMSRLPYVYFGFIIALCILGTVSTKYQGILPAGEYLECFSLSKNWEKLFETKNGDFSEIHGIRTTSAIGLLLSHKNMAMLYNPYINRTAMSEVLGRPWSVIGRTAIIYTDGFILISGYLSSMSFFKDLRNKGRIDMKESTISRYWRLVPNLLTVIVFCTCVLPYMNSGPQWNVVVRKHALLCQSSWWRNLLFIHNFFGFENMCLTHTHQLGIDFQLFLMAPAVVFLLWKWPRRGCFVALALATLSTVLRFVVTHSKSLSPVIYFGVSVSQLLDTANYSYILPYHRLTVYLMGIGVYYFLMKFPECIFNKVQITLLWMVAVLSGMAAMIGPYHMTSITYKYDAQEAALYNSFSPILWGAFVGWGIVASSYGYAGWLGKLMAWDKFQVISRLSYSIYLVQFPVFFYNVGTKRHPETYSPSVMFNFEEYAVIVFFSILLTLMVEMPANNLRSLYKRNSSSVRRKSENAILAKQPQRNLGRKILKRG
ncbi:hypothetical protein GE061_000686 [Apolygus lucorum]|uniref:Nose resistant-to-fluoxetine protein N-terminal domain-containing protein n=1 Tax=Apolygus lucorum TaxID=248454 RepID=A0A8S9Y9S8_APOLU|nr:hypothetical protein GE061_000686 [Apolygus lucorum]